MSWKKATIQPYLTCIFGQVILYILFEQPWNFPQLPRTSCQDTINSLKICSILLRSECRIFTVILWLMLFSTYDDMLWWEKKSFISVLFIFHFSRSSRWFVLLQVLNRHKSGKFFFPPPVQMVDGVESIIVGQRQRFYYPTAKWFRPMV